jgi:hypothetical protein
MVERVQGKDSVIQQVWTTSDAVSAGRFRREKDDDEVRGLGRYLGFVF